MASPRVVTVTTFIEKFGKLDFDALKPLVGPNFKWTILPKSAGMPPPAEFDEWIARMGGLLHILKGYPLTPTLTIDCGDAENKVVINAVGQAQFKEEVMDDGIPQEEWVHNGEYMIIFMLNEDAKIESVLEFLDSKAAERFGGLLKRARGNLQQKMGKA